VNGKINQTPQRNSGDFPNISGEVNQTPPQRRAFPVNRQVVFRAASVVFLSYAFLSMSFQHDAGPMPRERFPVLQTAEIGVGGGDLGGGDASARLGKTDDGLTETESTLLTGVLEPESFSKPRTLLYSSYRVKQGDIIGELAAGFGLSQDTLISLNNIKNARLLQIGQILRVPNQDGIMYTVKGGDTVATIAEKYKADADTLRFANELFFYVVPAGTALFIPGAKLDWMERQEIYGDLFMWPVSGYITSNYGYRSSPFGGSRQFHSGVDIGAPIGHPVRAAMSGRVSSVSYDAVLGNYIVVTHHSGYRTMYGHLSVARVKTGAYVGTGERIGDVGISGLTTGPHVHFTVYKNGVTVNPRTLMR
jgi:murein DD-endopeptidase MepM/ murein hydrolase activator NlpD